MDKVGVTCGRGVVEKVGEWWGRVGDWDVCFHNLQCPCCVLGLFSLLVFGVFFNCV